MPDGQLSIASGQSKADVITCSINGEWLTPLCECGDIQSINHIVQSCPNMKFEGGLVQLHEGSPAATKWLDKLAIRL